MTPPKHRGGFTEAQKLELTMIIDAAVKTAVAPAIRAELREAGFRLDSPAHLDATAADMSFVRKARLWFEGTAGKVGGAIILAFVSGIVWLIVAGAQAFFSAKP